MLEFAKFLKKAPVYILIILCALSALFPLYYMFVTAFKSQTEFYDNPFGIPLKPTLENIINVMVEKQFYKYLLNTILLTVVSTLIAIIVSVFASFAYAKKRFKGRDTCFNLTIGLTSVPAIVVLVPLYAVLAKLGMLNTYFGTSLVYAGFMLPFCVFVLTSFFKTIDNEIIDAAKVDGCSEISLIARIFIPLSKPALITLFIIDGLWVWNELLIALLLLQDNDKRTLVVQLGLFQGRYVYSPTLIMAGSLFVGLPMIIIYLIGQKYFVKGLTSGAIK